MNDYWFTVTVCHDTGCAEFAAHRYVSSENQSARYGVDSGKEANAVGSPVPLIRPDFCTVIHVEAYRKIYLKNKRKEKWSKKLGKEKL